MFIKITTIPELLALIRVLQNFTSQLTTEFMIIFFVLQIKLEQLYNVVTGAVKH